MIAVIDYGMGNLTSVAKALETVGGKVTVADDPRVLRRAAKIVFPGVGSFGPAMRELKSRRLIDPLKDAIAKGKPFLGLCLGLHLLFERSEESPGVPGLGILKGSVRRFRFSPRLRRLSGESLKIPHMGWNTIVQASKGREGRAILAGIPNGTFVYFVHSYYAKPKDPSVVLTTTTYGSPFASGIGQGSLFAFQFHPEKSQAKGLTILKNFVRL